MLISAGQKQELVRLIIAELAKGLDVYARAARAAHAEATHESSRAENKYDTRGLEASYLARGQSRQAAETAEAIESFEQLPLRVFEHGEPIDLGALVELGLKGARTFYFIGPRGGGTEVTYEGREVMVLTPGSPLGRQLVGRKAGERVTLDVAGCSNQFRVEAVG